MGPQRSRTSLRRQVDQLQRQTAPLAGAAGAAGLSIKGIIDQTKDFQESKFGYGFARLTDHMKDGRLDIRGWRDDMNRAGSEARLAAKHFGTNADVTMKAREEVEKLGFKGSQSSNIFNAAVGLHLTEPKALPSGEAAKYIGSVYRAYSKQMAEEAKKQGVAVDDEGFQKRWINRLASRAALAGAELALGPGDIVEGMRQFAPQWAAMGVSYETALAMLAHGSNYGFRAPELGTAMKSMMTKIIKPTGDGLQVLNSLGINRQEFMRTAPEEPIKAFSRMNSLFGGALMIGKGSKEQRQVFIEMLETGRKQGVTGTPEFQEALTQEVMRKLGPGWAGRADEVQQRVANATMSAEGGADVMRPDQKNARCRRHHRPDRDHIRRPTRRPLYAGVSALRKTGGVVRENQFRAGHGD